ncbi:MAG TPA: anti-phage ZorAB system protein ZorA [Steroidobacteraceae bacterium]|nr:anti-phage ZorAB system protein ZorA [Steroidobacteraceae bacterium]
MLKLLQYFQANPLIFMLGSLVVVLLVHFLAQYLVRGLGLRWQLARLVEEVGAAGPAGSAELKARLAQLFQQTRLARAWREFEESLHEQRVEDAAGREAVAIRATQPAEAFFNLDTVLDPRIGSEYFRHLPGILTGLGIIGTFFGLIQGLVHFDPSLADSASLKRGLGELFGHVRDAFMFSGSAIAAAIAVTMVEKWLYASCAKWVFELAAALDEKFKSGIGEEYLASILRTSQDSALQVRDLKAAMSEDLRTLLTHLADRQVQATQQMSADIARSIRQSLQEPLADIARTVALVSGRETELIRNALEELMTAFLTQMRETMGRQMSELSGLIQQAARAVHQLEVAMQDLLHDVQQSGQDSAASMRSAVQELLQRLSETQRAQSELVSSSMRDVLRQLNEAATRMLAAQEDAARRARDGNQSAEEHMRRQVATIADSHITTIGATRELLARFNSSAGGMIDKMTSGTTAVVTALGSLQQAAEQMSRAGLELAALEGQAQRSSHDMVRASSHLALAAQNVNNSINQLNNAAVRFEGVASSAGVEANARRQILISLQDLIDQSHVASREFVSLAHEARKALDASVEHFDSEVHTVLSGHVRAYQKQLGDSVTGLRRALEQLATRTRDQN